jgi:hypothetical protein
LGCVYTLHENSLYSSINAFLEIENDLVNLIEKDMKCALVGDFNAKTGNDDNTFQIIAKADLHISKSFRPKLFGLHSY